jgi:hypothetical protein
MAALDFPVSPVTGQAFSALGKTWTWDGAAWLGLVAATGYGSVTDGNITGGSASAPDALIKITTITPPVQYAPVNSPGLTGEIGLFGSQRGRVFPVAASDIDLSKANYFTKSVAGNTTFTVSNVPSIKEVTSPPVLSFTLEITYTSGTVVWPTGTLWAFSTPPTLSVGNNLIFFVTDNGGAVWYASFMNNFA